MTVLLFIKLFFKYKVFDVIPIKFKKQFNVYKGVIYKKINFSF